MTRPSVFFTSLVPYNHHKYIFKIWFRFRRDICEYSSTPSMQHSEELKLCIIWHISRSQLCAMRHSAESAPPVPQKVESKRSCCLGFNTELHIAELCFAISFLIPPMTRVFFLTLLYLHIAWNQNSALCRRRGVRTPRRVAYNGVDYHNRISSRLQIYCIFNAAIAYE
jgi:hypothetical protein